MRDRTKGHKEHSFVDCCSTVSGQVPKCRHDPSVDTDLYSRTQIEKWVLASKLAVVTSSSSPIFFCTKQQKNCCCCCCSSSSSSFVPASTSWTPTSNPCWNRGENLLQTAKSGSNAKWVSVCLPKSHNPTLDRSSMTVSVMRMLVPSCCYCIPAAPASTCVIPQHHILSFFHPRGSIIYLFSLTHELQFFSSAAHSWSHSCWNSSPVLLLRLHMNGSVSYTPLQA